MPIYEYVCRACNRHIEVLQKVNDPPLSECTHCGEAALRKKVSAAAFRLKGGGWYETDFKTGDKKKNLAGDTDKKPAKDGGGAGDGKADSGSGKSSGGDSAVGGSGDSGKKDSGKKSADKSGA